MASTLSLDEKIDYCLNISTQLSRDNRREVLQWFMLNIEADRIHESEDGCRIDLDILPPDKLEGLYQFMKYKLES